ncbi:MAG: F0F1 ATP synthase subunit A [Alphaproteobacteria bacterium]|nr:F0F1 ATP synthase subunit A [Alphaproteobacteria bacterium]
MTTDLFGSPVVAWLGPVPVTTAMLTSLLVTGTLLGVAALLGRAVTEDPDGTGAAAARGLVRFVDGVATDAAGHATPTLGTFAGTLLLFIATSAVVGQLPGLRAPTADLAVTAALALLVFLAVPVAGIRARGVRGYLGHYAETSVFLAPIEVISELSRTVALALRLFGNMMSGHLVVALLVALVGPLVPIPLMALDLAIGLLQAYIFTLLACVYVGAAIRVGAQP